LALEERELHQAIMATKEIILHSTQLLQLVVAVVDLVLALDKHTA
jgi:hypothetical protein